VTLRDLFASLEESSTELIELTQELVAVPSINTGVMPTGNETPACEVIQRKLTDNGIDSEILESAPGRGNLVARLSGDGGGASLLLMGHVDVVPVEDADQWTHPPFSAEIADGRIWGRGSTDMKAMVAAETMVMVLFRRHGLPLYGDLVLAAGADEEAGGTYGFAWLAENYPDKLRADFAVNEGGGHPIRRNGALVYPVDTGEKGRLEVRIIVTGSGYHASAPWMADNAILKARPVLDRLTMFRPEVAPDPDLFAGVAEALGLEEGIDEESIDPLIENVSLYDPQLGSWIKAASRMTIAPTMIQAGVKSNSVAETCTIVCDVRTLPWQDETYVARCLDKVLEGVDSVRYEITTTAEPGDSELTPEIKNLLTQSLEAALDDESVAIRPSLSVGFTDSRLVRPLGIPAFGFSPAHPDSDPSLNGAHNINESVGIDDLMIMARSFLALAYLTAGSRQ
jgi:acetylornithine deacetylase/succinyl-diaminopimelate desuccinylase-like protein